MSSAPLSELDLTDRPPGCNDARLRYLKLAVRDGSYRTLDPEQLAETLLAASLLVPPSAARPVA